MKLILSPEVALCDQKTRIAVSGVPPRAQVRLEASMRLPWAPSVVYESFACFTADDQGVVDPSTQAPDSGSYDFVDPMGLVACMTSPDKNAIKKIVRDISIDSNLVIDIRARCGEDEACGRLERSFLASGITREALGDGLVGELFHGGDSPDRGTVVLLGGSGSSLGVLQPLAALLASRGFNVLSLPFFGEKGLPAQLSKVPLEYFEKAFAWLATHPATRGKEINLFAISKGAELALLLASKYPAIKKVAAFAPHAFCFQGTTGRHESSWTCNGVELPFIRVSNRVLLGNLFKCFIKNEPFGFTYSYRKALDAAKNKEEARIKIENARADLLIFTSRQCNMWNTYDGCVEIMEALRRSGYPHHHELVVYDDAGEPYYAPYVFPVTETKVALAPRLVLSTGGTLQANAHARVDSWERAIAFLKS